MQREFDSDILPDMEVATLDMSLWPASDNSQQNTFLAVTDHHSRAWELSKQLCPGMT
jgi:hypothetical protein